MCTLEGIEVAVFVNTGELNRQISHLESYGCKQLSSGSNTILMRLISLKNKLNSNTTA